jgi:hypothetical protein
MRAGVVVRKTRSDFLLVLQALHRISESVIQQRERLSRIK